MKKVANRRAHIDEIAEENIHAIISSEHRSHQQRSFGQRAADTFARIIGSWSFVIIQSVVLFGWIIFNTLSPGARWDPFPFILLNLMLSFQAAYTSPLVLMSQNRQGQVADRRNHLDLQINLLAEQENTEMLKLLSLICEKLDIQIPERKVLAALEKHTEPIRLLKEIEQGLKKAEG